jgi:hypothetical protein
MSRHDTEHIVVMVLGFIGGVVLAVGIAPGDVFLWVVTGIVLGLFCRAFFVSRISGGVGGPPADDRRPHGRRTHGRKLTHH